MLGNIFTTCGHMYFRYGFRELATGKHPGAVDWVSGKEGHHNMARELGPLPQYAGLQEKEQDVLITILADASIERLS